MKDLVANIGGVFIYSKDPAKLAQWYKKALGINYKYSSHCKAWCAEFKYYEDKTAAKEAFIAWAIMRNENRPKLKQKVFTVNYRVKNLDETVAHLKKLRISTQEIKT